MKVLVLVLLLAGCSNAPRTYELGDEVTPPYGCVELRKENPEADC